MDKEKLQEERKNIFKKIDDLDNVIHVLEVTANVYYNPDDKMWNILLKSRDSVKKHIVKEEIKLYKEVENIDKKLSDLKNSSSAKAESLNSS